MNALNVDKPFYEISFDFTLHAEQANAPATDINRPRAAA